MAYRRRRRTTRYSRRPSTRRTYRATRRRTGGGRARQQTVRIVLEHNTSNAIARPSLGSDGKLQVANDNTPKRSIFGIAPLIVGAAAGLLMTFL